VLPADEPVLRADVLASLARALAYRGHRSDAAEVRDAAIAEARASGDQRVLARALSMAHAAPYGRSDEELLAWLAEARTLAERSGDEDLAMEAAMWRVVALTRSGEPRAARAELTELERTADAAGRPFALHVAAQFDSALALAEGRLAAAEEAAEVARARGETLRGGGVQGAYGIQMFGVRREQGRVRELAQVARVLARGGAPGAWREGLVALLAEAGLVEEARAELERLRVAGREPGGIAVGVAGLVYLAEAAILLGDVDAAEALLPELESHEGEVLMVGQLVACQGSADRLIGALEAVCGRLDEAVGHLERGLAADIAAGYRTWAGWGAQGLADALGRRSGPGDAERAAQLAEQARRLADALGLRALADRVAVPAAAPEAPPDDLSPREVTVLRLIASGRSNRAIAQELVISEHTVANHVRNILRKTGSANRTEAGDYAHRKGLVDS
jgi:DNA-binding CsgD family transcriptional regulator